VGSTFDLFKSAERIEALAGAIYGALANQFCDDEPTRAMFAKLEAEELQHASRVRLLAGAYRADSKLIGRVAGAAELEGCCAAAEAALAEVLAGAWAQDLAGIKRRLAVLELDMAKAHAHFLSQDGHPGLRDFFRQLADQDDAHLALLEP